MGGSSSKKDFQVAFVNNDEIRINFPSSKEDEATSSVCIVRPSSSSRDSTARPKTVRLSGRWSLFKYFVIPVDCCCNLTLPTGRIFVKKLKFCQLYSQLRHLLAAPSRKNVIFRALFLVHQNVHIVVHECATT